MDNIRITEKSIINRWIKLYQRNTKVIKTLINPKTKKDLIKQKLVKPEELEKFKNFKCSYLVIGKDGIGKTQFIKRCLDENINLNIKRLNLNSQFSLSNLKQEYERLSQNYQLQNFWSFNEKDKIESVNILLIDQNEYFNLFVDKQNIKTLLSLNNKNRDMLIILISGEEYGLELYQNIKPNCELLKLSPLNIKEKKMIFDFDNETLLNSTDNLNVLKMKIKLYNNGIYSEYKKYNENHNLDFENFDVKKNKQFKTLNFKSSVISNLLKFNITNKNIGLFVQENFIPIVLEKTNKDNKKESKRIIKKINKSIILNDKFKSLVNIEQYWFLNKYNIFTSFIIPFYYLNTLNLGLINNQYFNYPKILNIQIYRRRDINIYNDLKLYFNNNIEYMFMLFYYIKKSFISNNRENNGRIIKFYDINEQNLLMLSILFKNKKLIDEIIKFIQQNQDIKNKVKTKTMITRKSTSKTLIDVDSIYGSSF